MNSKILSICIPSYNMEQYLDRSVSSLVASKELNNIEIIIVNDGSKDQTLQIAQAYKEKYSQSIIVIDKPNGHYGSTVNAAIQIATGKYFRILDADDWFDTISFDYFIHKLRELDTDCVFTKFTIHDFKHNTLIEQDITNVIFDKVLTLDEYIIPQSCYYMHSLTYKLQLLKEIHYTQTEGICYTDSEYVFFPLRAAKDIYNMNISLYQYYVGRNDQSMSPKVLLRNMRQYYILSNRFITNYIPKSGNRNVDSIQDIYIYQTMIFSLRAHILYNWYNEETDSQLRSNLNLLKNTNPTIYAKLLQIQQHGIKWVKVWIKHKTLHKYLFSPIKLYFVYKRK